ncbi:hypothetical protein COL8621_03572 [Actibacterium lipolyticum]|uniref:Uncharacterized protein n=1 Tax=Actibacterium lipolyticum TaxID=1524263 RepID=A0A238L9J9_9RHOB|nr:hypothetical protein COL8621_03572 [Actibacterium lipolyticum]
MVKPVSVVSEVVAGATPVGVLKASTDTPVGLAVLSIAVKAPAPAVAVLSISVCESVYVAV